MPSDKWLQAPNAAHHHDDDDKAATCKKQTQLEVSFHPPFHASLTGLQVEKIDT